MSLKRTHEQFIQELTLINPNIEVLGQYISTNTKIECRCKICGRVWNTLPKLLLKGHGCSKCSFDAMGVSRRKSNDQFLSELHHVNPNITPLEKYINDSHKIDCKCNICGLVWKITPNKLLNGSGCPKCNGGTRKTDKEFCDELINNNIPIIPLETYVNAYTKIKLKCKICGHEWSASPTTILNKHRFCPVCSRIKKERIAAEKKRTTTEFRDKISLISPHIEIIGEYINNTTKIECVCSRCNHRWHSLPTNLIKGRGCPQCSHTSTSFVEQTIALAFRNVLGEGQVKTRDSSMIGMELDIYVPSLALAIEPGNWYWHKDKITRDIKKRSLCIKNGIRLITLFDGFYGDPNLFTSDFYYTDVSLNEKNNYWILKDIIYRIFDTLGIDRRFSSDEWENITNQALEKSKKKTTEQFITEIETISPDIQVQGEYNGNKIAILCQCKKCGWEWSPTPDKLLQGRGCPNCAGTMKKSHDKFAEELQEINPSIAVLGQYKNSKTKIKVKCLVCDNEWDVAPTSLLSGHGCPQCAQKRRKSI